MWKFIITMIISSSAMAVELGELGLQLNFSTRDNKCEFSRSELGEKAHSLEPHQLISFWLCHSLNQHISSDKNTTDLLVHWDAIRNFQTAQPKLVKGKTSFEGVYSGPYR